jgi:hypothetical protein
VWQKKMDNNNENNPGFELEPPSNPQLELSESDKRIKKGIDEILGDLDAGMKVSINREQPKWARGWVETIDVGDAGGVNFDLEYLADTWGGEYYALRFLRNGKFCFSKHVRIAGPPKNQSIIIEHPDKVALREKIELANQKAAIDRQTAAQQQPAQNPLMETILTTLLSNSSTKDLENFKMMQEAMRASTPQTQSSQLKDMMQMFEFFKKFRGEPEPAPVAENNDMDLMKMFMAVMSGIKQNQPQQQPQPQRQQPRRYHQPPQTQPVQNPFQGQRQTNMPPIREVKPAEMTKEEMANQIATMESGELSNFIEDVFSRLPQDKQQDLFNMGSDALNQETTGDDVDFDDENDFDINVGG